MIVYCPDSLVTAIRVFSIKAGLATSTVAPGSTAPEASLTTPATVPSPWAAAQVGTSNKKRTTDIPRFTWHIDSPVMWSDELLRPDIPHPVNRNNDLDIGSVFLIETAV